MSLIKQLIELNASTVTETKSKFPGDKFRVTWKGYGKVPPKIVDASFFDEGQGFSKEQIKEILDLLPYEEWTDGGPQDSVTVVRLKKGAVSEGSDSSEPSFDELLDAFMQENKMYSFEGNKGLEYLCHIVSALGYKDSNHSMQLSSKASIGDLVNFLVDNPGVFEVILEFIKNNDSQEWAENLKDHMGE